MALAAGLTELQAEARCPLCLDTLREPVTLDCGHNCCDSCLQQRWEHLLDTLPCPVCQHRCPRRNVKRNSQLALLADLVRQLPGQRVAGAAQEPRGRCDAHQQPLSLFCEEDLELLCGQCGASAAHRGHALTPMGQAAAHHRRKLKGSLERLRQQLEEAERSQQRERAKSRELRKKVQKQKTELLWESEDLKRYLRIQYNVLDSGVLRQMMNISKNTLCSKNRLSEYSATLRTVLQDLLGLSLQPDQGLLSRVGVVHQRWDKCRRVPLPASFSYQGIEPLFIVPPHYIGLQAMISKFQVDLTLDPDTAHPSLVVSQDRKTLSCCQGSSQAASGPHPKAFTFHEAVLGAQSFQGGRHFWQVQIQGSGMWALGVCKESFPRNAPVEPTPANGCWQLQQFSDPQLDARPVQCRVGVFLDFELGEVSFYNLDTRSHLNTLTETFAGTLLPYFFCVGLSSLSFSMTIVSE